MLDEDGGASGAAAASPPSMAITLWYPSAIAMAAACVAELPCVEMNTMVSRSDGGFACGPSRARSLHCVALLRSTCASSSMGILTISRRLEMPSSSGCVSASSLALRTSTSTGLRHRDSTSIQNAAGDSRAGVRRLLISRMEGSPVFSLYTRARDFWSASFAARSTRMDHAMSDRHTAVVRDPPMLVMCTMAVCRAVEPFPPPRWRPSLASLHCRGWTGSLGEKKPNESWISFQKGFILRMWAPLWVTFIQVHPTLSKQVAHLHEGKGRRDPWHYQKRRVADHVIQLRGRQAGKWPP